jgi:hypothetical protein
MTLAGDDSGLAHASAVVLQALQAVVTGQARDAPAQASAIDQAAAQQGVPLDQAARGQLVGLLAQLQQLDAGAQAHGYRIEQLGPDHVRLVGAPGA